MTSKTNFSTIFSFTNTNTFLVFSSISLLLFLSSYPPKVSAVLGADPMSLMRIIKGLCGSSHDQNFANGFYGCYSKLETKEKCIFDNCQKSAFGCTLSSKENIQHSCTAMDKLLPYTNCLMNQFQMCGLDVVKAVTIVNICQGNLLGLE